MIATLAARQLDAIRPSPNSFSTLDQEELSLETNHFCREFCLRGRRPVCTSHAPWSAFIIGHFLPHNCSRYEEVGVKARPVT
jgi:hypothetical protein